MVILLTVLTLSLVLGAAVFDLQRSRATVRRQRVPTARPLPPPDRRT